MKKSKHFTTLENDDLSVLHYAIMNLIRDFPYPVDGTELEKSLNKRINNLAEQLKYEIKLRN